MKHKTAKRMVKQHRKATRKFYLASERHGDVSACDPQWGKYCREVGNLRARMPPKLVELLNRENELHRRAGTGGDPWCNPEWKASVAHDLFAAQRHVDEYVKGMRNE